MTAHLKGCELKILVPKEISGGVRDHAELLSRHVPIAAEVLGLDRSNAASISLSGHNIVLLAYSGYGFADSGAPYWLVKWVQNIAPKVRSFGTIFHELYAFGSPFSRAFWYHPFQKQVARRLARASSFLITSRFEYLRWLVAQVGNIPHLVAPVFSNVGECEQLGLWNGARAVVFGSGEVRRRFYDRHLQKVVAWAGKARIEIHDVGPVPSARLVDSMRDAGIVIHGEVPSKEAGEILRGAGWGLIAYEPAFLAKSSIFAAYAAHGLCPLVFSRKSEPADGLLPGVHYLNTTHLADIDFRVKPDRVAREVFGWYQTHNLAVQSGAVQALLYTVTHSNG